MRRKIALPELELGQYALLRIDPQTGTVLQENGEWATGIGDRHMSVFPSIEAARECALNEQQKNEAGEWLIANRDQLVVETIVGREKQRESYCEETQEEGWLDGDGKTPPQAARKPKH